jgi:hypothetical protein
VYYGDSPQALGGSWGGGRSYWKAETNHLVPHRNVDGAILRAVFRKQSMRSKKMDVMNKSLLGFGLEAWERAV